MTLELADRSITRSKGVAEYVFVKVGKFHFLTDFVVVDFEADPRVPLILGRSFLRTSHALIDVYGEEITLRVNDEVVTFNLNQTTRYSSTYDEMSGDICLIEKLLNDDPFQLPPMDLKQREVAKANSSIEEPSELELKDLPSHLEYAFLEGVDKLPVIIAKYFKNDEKEALLKEDYKPAVQSQRRVNPKIHKVIKKEVIKLLDAGMIYPISNSLWVSPIHCVPKKGGITVVENENNELIPTRLVTGWRVCIDYRKLNDATRKDHFPLPFMGQMLERLAGNEFYCFLDGFSGYFQILINQPDQEKATFTCPYGTFSYRRMPFSLCDVPGTFQRCMMAIFHDMIEKTVEVFIDDFLEKATFTYPYGTFSYRRMPFSLCDVPGTFQRTPRAIISDRETHFCNDKFAKVMSKYGVTHRLATAYHPQTSRQMEVSNRGLKRILERTVGENRASWSEKLEDALWAFRTAYKTLIGCTPYKLVYRKSCHLPIELEHKAYWALKHINFDLKTAGDHRKLQLNELNELRDQAYKNSLIYKEKAKKLHDSKIKNCIFNVGDRVLLFNSSLKIFSRKLKSRWSGPFTIAKVFPYEIVELSEPEGPNFKVNVHRMKHYFGGDIQ
nr:reverse transcriptase domain-containing protein [Tanacetum cinerariifolium]